MSLEIGLAFDLRADVGRDDAPSDALEEYDSIDTIEAVESVLAAGGHRVRRLGGGRGFVREVLEQPPELVFNMAEGRGSRSREAHVPAVCELLEIPYTHSDPLTLAATLTKDVAKVLVAAAGVPTPRFWIAGDGGSEPAPDFPVVAKPIAEGSSVGIRRSSLCEDEAALAAEVARLLADYGQPVLIEQLCPGPEFTVGVLGTGANAVPIGVMEIVPRNEQPERFLYSLEAKREGFGAVEYHVPPRRPSALVDQVVGAALTAYRALGCCDVARIDLRLDAAGVPNFLEANPLPGLKPGWGDIVVLAEASGVTHGQLITRIVACARTRLGI